MKTVITVMLFLLSLNLNAQSSWLYIGAATGAEFYEHDYSYQGGHTNQLVEAKKSFGYHAGLRAGVRLNAQLSIRSGVDYSEKRMFPRLILGFAYGPLIVDFEETELWDPYLDQHQFKTLDIPLMLVYKPALESKIKPVISGGINGSFQFYESEVYKGNAGFFFNPAAVDPSESIAISDNSFRTFGWSFDAGIGLSYELTGSLCIELTQRISALEFRPGNEKWKGNDRMLYEDDWLWLSKNGAELTILKSF